MDGKEFMSIAPLIAPHLAGLATVLAIMTADAITRDKARLWVAALGLAGSSTLSFWSGWVNPAQGAFDDALQVGAVHAHLAGFLYAIALVCVIAGWKNLSELRNGGQVAALIASAALASSILSASTDIGLTLIALETVALSGYALVASSHTDRSDEASMKYFVQGAVVTGLLVLGIAVLLGYVGGGLRYQGIWVALGILGSQVTQGASDVSALWPVLVVMVAIGSAVSFKLGAFPFHSWAPDAFEASRPVPAAALSTIPKVGMLVAAATIFAGLFAGAQAEWSILVAILATASIVYGNLAALNQNSYQRMLGYSGIAQAGYALSALLAPTYVRLFAMTYALGALGSFLAAQAVSDSDDEWDGSISGLAGLAGRRPLLAAAIAVQMLSLTGIPLTVGFWGKFFVFLGVSQAGWTWLAVVGFVGSVVSFGYYGRVLRTVYLDASTRGEAADGTEATGGDGGPAVWMTAFVALLVLAGGVLPAILGFRGIAFLFS